MISLTVIYGTLAPFLVVFPLKWRYSFMSNYARKNLWLLKIICGVEYQVTGQENIPKQASIIFCKHQSTWETLALQAVFPAQVWVLKRELLRVPFFGWGLAALKPIAIDRSASTKAVNQIADQGKDRLGEGFWVVIFPEGTRMAAGETGRYGIGGGILASRAKVPLVPVAHNAGSFWPRRQFIKQPGVVQMEIGPAIYPEDKSPKAVVNEGRDWIESRMPELERGLLGEVDFEIG